MRVPGSVLFEPADLDRLADDDGEPNALAGPGRGYHRAAPGRPAPDRHPLPADTPPRLLEGWARTAVVQRPDCAIADFVEGDAAGDS